VVDSSHSLSPRIFNLVLYIIMVRDLSERRSAKNVCNCNNVRDGRGWLTTKVVANTYAENKPSHFFRFRDAPRPGHFQACVFFIFILLITFAPVTVYDTTREPLTSYNQIFPTASLQWSRSGSRYIHIRRSSTLLRYF
jgi:hypothetical protein